jgi:hypothetical protein
VVVECEPDGAREWAAFAVHCGKNEGDIALATGEDDEPAGLDLEPIATGGWDEEPPPPAGPVN